MVNNVGEIGQLLHCRINGHRYNITHRRTEDSLVTKLFTCDGHTLVDIQAWIADVKSSMFKSWNHKLLINRMVEAYPWFTEPPWGTREDFQSRWGGVSTQSPCQECTDEKRNEVAPILDWRSWKGEHNHSGMLQRERQLLPPYIAFTEQRLQYYSTCGGPLWAW